jgi:hypothetical protein
VSPRLPQVSTLPSISVRYDSSESLYLCKVLNPSLAHHRAVLRHSTNPGEPALDGGGTPGHKYMAVDAWG